MKHRRFTLFAAPIALVFALVLALTAASARVQAQAPQPAAQSEPAPAAGPAAIPAGAAEEGHAAHAGHHPEIKLFGKSLGTMAQFGVTVFNFILFAAILYFILKGVLAAAFKARTKELEDKLSQAEREKDEAGQQIQELEAKMAGLQQELEGIMAKAEVEADVEKQRILESAQTEAAQIRLQTKAEIDAQKRQAETELRALVTELVMAKTTQRLQTEIQGDLAAGVLDKAIEQVGGAK